MNEIEQKIFTHWLKKKISEFVITQQDSYENDWHATDRGIANYVLNDFMEFINKEIVEKEKRRKLYEELKKEFEG